MIYSVAPQKVCFSHVAVAAAAAAIAIARISPFFFFPIRPPGGYQVYVSKIKTTGKNYLLIILKVNGKTKGEKQRKIRNVESPPKGSCS